MKIWICLVVLLALSSLTGCSWKKRAATSSPVFPELQSSITKTDTNIPNRNIIVTSGEEMEGRVASINAGLEFVVLTFPSGKIPALDKKLIVYRNGVKVGEIKITGPQRGENIVADIMSGEAQKGDEVREK